MSKFSLFANQVCKKQGKIKGVCGEYEGQILWIFCFRRQYLLLLWHSFLYSGEQQQHRGNHKSVDNPKCLTRT